MPQTSFAIRVNDVVCRNLTQAISQSHLRFDFGGFKQFHLHGGRGTDPQFDFSLNFLYQTAFASRLQVKYLTIELFEKGLLSDTLVGTAKVDLHTLATGPKSHMLNFWKAGSDRRDHCGQVLFELEMIEVCSNLVVTFSNVVLKDWNPMPFQLSQLRLDYLYGDITDTQRKSELLPGNAMPPCWNGDLPSLQLKTDMSQLTDGKEGKFFISLKIVSSGATHDTEFAKATMDALSYYAMDEQSTPFEVPLIEEKGRQVGRLGGEIVFCNGPSFAQLPGERDQALNSDDRGVQATTMPRFGFPLPSRYKAPSITEVRSGPRGSVSPQTLAPPMHAMQHGAGGAPLSVSIDPSAGGAMLAPPLSPLSYAHHFGFGHAPMTYASPLPISPRGSGGYIPAGSPSSSSSSSMLSYVPPSPPASSPGGAAPGSPSTPSLGPSDAPIKPIARAKIPEDDAEPLPRNWTFAVDSRERLYFKYKPTKQTTWLDPRFLPPGWEQMISSSGQVYFQRKSSKATTWIDPRGMPDRWSLNLDGDGKVSYDLTAANGSVITCLVDPRGLPSGVTMAYSNERSRFYFKDKSTQSTTWTDPRATIPSKDIDELRRTERLHWDMAQLRTAALLKRDEEKRSHLLDGRKKKLTDEFEKKRNEVNDIKKKFIKEAEHRRKLAESKEDHIRDEVIDAASKEKSHVQAKHRDQFADLEVELRAEAEKRRGALRTIQRSELDTAELRYNTKRDMANAHYKDQQKALKELQDAEISAKRTDWDHIEASLSADFDERLTTLDRQWAEEEEKKEKEAFAAKLSAEIAASAAADAINGTAGSGASRGSRGSVVMSFAPSPSEGGPQLYLMQQPNGIVAVCEDGTGGWLAFPTVNTSVGPCANHPTGLVPLNTLQTLLPAN